LLFRLPHIILARVKTIPAVLPSKKTCTNNFLGSVKSRV